MVAGLRSRLARFGKAMRQVRLWKWLLTRLPFTILVLTEMQLVSFEGYFKDKSVARRLVLFRDILASICMSDCRECWRNL